MLPSGKLLRQRGERIKRVVSLTLAISMVSGMVPIGAIATPAPSSALNAPIGLTALRHTSEDTWYSDSFPTFAWDAVAGSDGYSYSLDQQLVDSTLDAVADPVDTTYAAGDPGEGIVRSRDVTLADLDKDGMLDAISGAGDWENQSAVSVTAGSFGGEFGTVTLYPVPSDGPVESVSTGDFNGDGYTDVVAVAPRMSDYDESSLSEMYVLLNDGTGALGAPVQYVPAGKAMAVEVADFDKNGSLDLAVVSQGYPNQMVSIYYGVGDGSFGTPEIAYVFGYAVDLTVGDINADSWLDIVTVSNPGGSGAITTVYNRGGHFTDTSNPWRYVGNQSVSVALGDVNEDGRVDIITGNADQYAKSTILRNEDNNGGWTQIASSLGSYWSYGGLRHVEIADMDGDGHLDVVGFHYSPWYGNMKIMIFKGAGDGSFAADPIEFYADGEAFSSFEVADLNGDGVLDVAHSPWLNSTGVTPYLAGPTKSYESVSEGEWYFHLAAVTDSGGMSEQVTRRVRIDTSSPEVAVSGVADGGSYVLGEAPQAVITGTDSVSGIASVWVEDSAGETVAQATGDSVALDLPTEPGTYTFTMGAQDLAGNETESDFSVQLVGGLAGLASATHPDPSEYYAAYTAKFTWEITRGAQYSYVISQDPDAQVDLEADLVADTSGAPTVTTYLSAYCPESAVTADFNEDGWMDYALAFDDDSGIMIYLNNGDGTFETDEDTLYDYYYYRLSGTVDDLQAVDMDLDGNVDLVYRYTGEGKIGIMWGQGDGYFDEPGEHTTVDGNYPSSLDVADLNGDIYPEIVVSYDGWRSFEAWHMDPEYPRNYTESIDTYDIANDELWYIEDYGDDYFSGAIAAADINDDHFNDVIVGTESGRLIVCLNDGMGAFSGATVDGPNGGPQAYAIDAFDSDDAECIVAEDLTGDGRTDIIASVDNDDVVLTRDGEGAWVQTFTEYTDEDSDDIATGDYNGDGVRDYAYAVENYIDVGDDNWEYVATLRVRLGDGEGGFTSAADIVLPDLSSDGQGIASADFNDDGLDDIVMSGSDDTCYVITMSVAADYNAIVENLEDGVYYFRIRQIGGEGEGAVGGPISVMQVNVGEEPITRTLLYSAAWGGTISGAEFQEVFEGSLGTTVTAVPNPGYLFDGWSDGSTSPERRDQATGDMELEARFVEDIETIENGSVKVTVSSVGRPSIAIWSAPWEQWVRQYYANNNWDTVLWLGGDSYSGGCVNAGSRFTPISNESVAIDGGQRIVTKMAAGESGAVLTQTITLMDGDRQVTKEWTIENGGAEAIESVRLYHGGDTYFGGEDSASGYYDDAKNMVYIRNEQFEDWGIMGFYANPATPATHYFEGEYSDGDDYAAEGSDLPDTVDAEYLDAGYYLQWDGGALAADGSWSIEANEIWTPGGPIQVLAPAPQNVLGGTTVVLPFTLQNLSEVPQDLTLEAVATGDWSARIIGSAAPEVGATARTEVLVEVTVPEGATGSESVTLRAVGTETDASGSTRLSAAALDLAVSPTSMSVSARIGETASVSVVVTNNGDSAVTLGNPTAASPFGIGSVSPESMILGPGESAEIEVKYTATEEVSTAGVLSIPVTGPVRVTLTVLLTGTGKPLAPPAPDSPYFRTTGPNSSLITWVGNDEALGYEVWVKGVLAGTVGAGVNRFVYAGTLGPNSLVTVIALGESDNSEPVRAAYLAKALAKVGQIQFSGFSIGLSKETKASIRSLVRTVKQQGFTRVQLDGYAAQVKFPGGASFRKWLSARRANAVRAYMVAEMKRQGVSVKVVASGHGSDNPLSSNKTASGRAANRRVEVSVR